MKKFWKVLGLGALAAGLTPYKVERNEETGESVYQALLWRVKVRRGTAEDGDDKWDIGVDVGEGTLTSKLRREKAGEPHLFSDELSVEYAAPEDAEEAADAAREAAEAAMDAADAAEEAAQEALAVAEAAQEAADEAAETAEE